MKQAPCWSRSDAYLFLFCTASSNSVFVPSERIIMFWRFWKVMKSPPCVPDWIYVCSAIQSRKLNLSNSAMFRKTQHPDITRHFLLFTTSLWIIDGKTSALVYLLLRSLSAVWVWGLGRAEGCLLYCSTAVILLRWQQSCDSAMCRARPIGGECCHSRFKITAARMRHHAFLLMTHWCWPTWGGIRIMTDGE